MRDLPVPVGAVLRDRYALREVIGQGGTATVYRAADRHRPGCAVAVKVAAHDGASALLADEARRLGVLAHPAIVRGRGLERDGTRQFLVMELLHGETLARALIRRAGRGLAPSLACAVATALGDALTVVHRAGLVHGDVKPGNVILTDQGAVKLIDFGGGAPALTAAYASPAVAAGRPPGPRDDVFALAVLTYAMLAGRHPFAGGSCAEAAAAGREPEAPAGLGPDRWAALRRGFAWDPAARPTTPRGFVAGLFADPCDGRFPHRRSAIPGGAGSRLRALFPPATVAGARVRREAIRGPA